ncbi:MAG: hypothetical protein CBC38_07935 [Gammaproteobacteria bacterium TMED78]|nr:MAG: hypothetical protein CBC38_07935 [Gammaproteobacteria bacterium TMED78]
MITKSIAFIFIKLLLIFISCTTISFAHHSRAEFPIRNVDPIELDGILTGVSWRNPHTEFELLVINADGIEESWTVEAWGGPATYASQGIERDMFVIGQKIKFLGWISTMQDNFFGSTNALLENGLETVLHFSADPVWSNFFVGGTQKAIRFGDEIPDAKEQNRGIFRNWTYAGTGQMTRDWPYTDESLRIRAQQDPLEVGVVNCEAPGMPIPMNPPLDNEFISINDNTIQLNVAYFDTTRYIYLNTSESNPLPDPSPLGYSKGHLEGNTLHVETTRINFPYFDVRNAPQSENVKVLETFTLSEDQSRLDYKYTVIDDLTFTRPATLTRVYLAIDEPFLPYGCD